MGLFTTNRIVHYAAVAGALFTTSLILLAYNQISSDEEVLFIEEYTKIKEQVLLKSIKSEEVVGNIDALFKASDYVEPNEFQVIAEEQLLRYPYINSIAFLPYVLATDVVGFEGEMKELNFVNYSVRSSKTEARNGYFPVKYIEPLTPKNALLLGVDLLSDDEYGPHIGEALRTGKMTIGNVETLKDGSAGFVLFKALYSGISAADKGDLLEMANAVLAINIDALKLMEGITFAENFQVQWRLNDDPYSSPSNGLLLFEKNTQQQSRALFFRVLHHELALGFGEASFSLNIEKRIYWNDIQYLSLLLAFVIGILLTTLLIVTARNIQLRHKDLQERNIKIQTQVKEKTYDLEKSKSSLNEAQKLALVGSWELDLRSNELKWSDEIFRIFEIDEGEFEASYEAFLNAIHPDDRELVNFEYTTSIAGRRAYDIEHRLLFSDGRIKHVHECGETEYDDEGKPISSRGTVQDITNRKQTELFVKNTAEILEMIAAGKSASSIYNAIALMYETRHPGLRCSMLELKGTKLIHGGAPSLPKEYCDAVNGLENGPSVGSCGTSTYTGNRVLVENIETDIKWDKIKHIALPHGMRCCWSEPIKSPKGKVLGAFDMYYNHPALPNEEELADLESAAKLAGIIMEREQREIALRQSEGKYRTLVENLPQRFFMKDKNSIFISCSKNLAQDLEITPEKIVGTTDNDYYPKDIAERYQQDDQRVMLTNAAEEFEEVVLVDGDEKVMHTIKAPVVDEDGHVDGIIGVFWDVTEQKELKEQLHQSQKMESVGTLVGGVAHEFNNTLAGITGRLYLAKNRAEGNPEVIRHIDEISNLSFRAAEMIQQLLTFSRKSPVQMQTFDLSAFIKDTFKLHRFSIPENINIETNYTHCALPVRGDANQVQQILVNLLHNARDAVLEVNKPQITMTLELFEADKLFRELHPDLTEKCYAHLMVEDNGCGISESDKAKIFDPFFTTKEVGKGTGLGLAMVYGATHTHNGFVEVDSVLNKGTGMHIYIPLSKDASVNIQENNSQVVQGQGEMILIVDDEPELRKTGRQVLESLGYSILEASNGSEAIEIYIANEKSIRLVIMDVVMPVMGGVEAAQAIKAHDQDVKIIFCTGYDKEDVLDDIDISTALVITKPYDIGRLSRTIRGALSSWPLL